MTHAHTITPDEREASPIMDPTARSREARLVTVTAAIDRLFSPGGHVRGLEGKNPSIS